jgi:hypothetical protein
MLSHLQIIGILLVVGGSVPFARFLLLRAGKETAANLCVVAQLAVLGLFLATLANWVTS